MAKGVKTGGRQKGTPNKLTGSVKEMLTQFVTNEVQHLPTLLNKLEPKEKIDFIVKLLPYIIPKMSPVESQKEQNKHERNRMLYQMFKAERE